MHMISFGGQLQNVKQFECTQVVSCQMDDCHPVGWFRKTWLVIHSIGGGSMQVGTLRREGRRKEEAGCEIGSVVVVVVIMRMIRVRIMIMVTMIYADHDNHDAKHEAGCEMEAVHIFRPGRQMGSLDQADR